MLTSTFMSLISSHLSSIPLDAYLDLHVFDGVFEVGELAAGDGDEFGDDVDELVARVGGPDGVARPMERQLLFNTPEAVAKHRHFVLQFRQACL